MHNDTNEQPFPPIDPKGDLGTKLLNDFEEFSQDRQYATDILIEQYLNEGAYVVEISPKGRARIRELLVRHAKRTGEHVERVPNYEEYENALRIVRAYEDAETAAKVARNKGGAK